MNPADILADKASGVPSHRVSPDRPGYAEWLERRLNQKTHVVHRLDKETTGAMIFAATAERAAELTELFTQKKIQKKYLFITDQKPNSQSWSRASFIEKDGKVFTSREAVPGESANSETHFQVLKNEGRFYLIEAQPVTGKTHQIRLHAADSNVPLLGDTLYGGTSFPHLFLHCQSLKGPDIDHQSEAPLIYKNLHLLNEPMLCQWLMSADRRQRLYPELVKSDQCLRLIHDEGTPLRVDKLGSIAHAGWWSDTSPSEREKELIKQLFELLKIESWYLQNYGKRKDPKSDMILSSAPEKWNARENGIIFEFHRDVGFSPGLFLDQRDQRAWVKTHARHKRVLNLFAYTGGLGLAAALGGASSVVTVDLSKKYIEWSKTNFALNEMSPESFKFHAMDSFEFLKYALKKGLEFDLIICDPPSFSRNDQKTFRIDRDFKDLIVGMKNVLSTDGKILFSTNYEAWTWADWSRELSRFCESQKLEMTENFSWQWDYETVPVLSLMKAFHMGKK